MLLELPIRTVGRSVLELRSMEFEDKRSAWFVHLAIAIIILFGKGYLEFKDSIFFGHGC